MPGNNITVDNGATATVKCVSHYGNPPATLRWYLGDQEIAPLHPQANSTEPDNPKTWSAASVVQIPATKERHSFPLKCLAFHDFYTARTVGVEAKLDVRCECLILNRRVDAAAAHFHQIFLCTVTREWRFIFAISFSSLLLLVFVRNYFPFVSLSLSRLRRKSFSCSHFSPLSSSCAAAISFPLSFEFSLLCWCSLLITFISSLLACFLPFLWHHLLEL